MMMDLQRTAHMSNTQSDRCFKSLGKSRLCGQVGASVAPMDPAYVHDESAASRCFVAFPRPWGSEAGSVKRTYIWMYGFLGG